MPLAKIAQKLFGPTQLTPSKNPFFDGKTIAINFFETTQNWGDTINLYLLEKISGKKPVIAPPSQQHILAVGSILRIANHNSIVWGSGFISKKGNIKYKPLKICAVRGPLTRSLLLKKGIETPEVYGDPALLMPRFYHPNVAKKYSLGVIPHYRDIEHPVVKQLEQQGARILDIKKNAEDFVDDLLECEHTISSSLHGLIASDSYGIPNQWVTLKNELTGGSFKFQDYYQSIAQRHQSPVSAEELATMSLQQIIEQCQLKPITLDLEKLLDAFPLDLDSADTDMDTNAA
ncbi:polysaccharide pyruvyl transferase family protein [Kangiella koreensis]|uniref:ExoV-like protein n=1 Tax=Kangiella koreensis (strain DSM 16069 / JCM 12317 / KCTC 12182 / SW-125) TaxID=523791 RepID=C7R9T6_KANKD|nr:polysaccharide pyruvyl transferase family protein [Kangiella koreensis]ACV27955.1 ExoV-like protein [Kangiella koreensis DSM 16069]